MDDDDRPNDEEAAEAYKQYLWEREFMMDNERAKAAWYDLVAECDSKRKEWKEAA